MDDTFPSSRVSYSNTSTVNELSFGEIVHRAVGQTLKWQFGVFALA
jgi:hypothetical protein